MNSMTGYGYEEITSDEYTLSVEIKSYNARFLDITVNLPAFLSRLENAIRDKVANAVSRGKVEVYIKLKEHKNAFTVEADLEAAKLYASEIAKIASAINIKQEGLLELVVAQEGVLSCQKSCDVDSYYAKIEPALSAALKQFVADRAREGENLKADILKMVLKLRSCAKVFEEWQPKMEEIFKENITKKFNELLGDKVDEARIMQETAVLLVKYTINEEIVRLNSHLQALENELLTNATPGKKIDFISQEINREINTIGSKNQIAEVGSAVISAKDALENIREQMRNVE